MTSIRIAIVDDHQVVRVGLRQSLEAEADIQVVGEAATGRDAVTLAAETRPDVMLLDVKLGETDMDGPETCRRVLEVSPRTAVLILTNYREDAVVLRSLVAGAKGYITKGVDLAELKRMIRAVRQGAAVLDPQITGSVISQLTAQRPAASAVERVEAAPIGLSDTDLTIIRLLVQGQSNKEIGTHVHLSPYTVRDHLKKIATALAARSRTEIVAQALKRGLV